MGFLDKLFKRDVAYEQGYEDGHRVSWDFFRTDILEEGFLSGTEYIKSRIELDLHREYVRGFQDGQRDALDFAPEVSGAQKPTDTITEDELNQVDDFLSHWIGEKYEISE